MFTAVRKRNVVLLIVILLAALLGPADAQAQGGAHATLFALDTTSFPVFSVALDVVDETGSFVTGLTTGQVTLLEDNLTLSPASLQEAQPGVKFTVALDAGPAFAFRDSDAVSRLDKVSEVLQNWASAHDDASHDLLGLVPNGQAIASQLTRAAEFSEALSAYQPELNTLASSLDTLSLAIDTVLESGDQTGMKRAVLYITSPPEANAIPALQNLTQRAVDLEVRVHVWIVASPDFFATSGATALKDLSILTGGTYALFSGVETLPNPETFLTPLRHTYLLTYQTGIRAPGMHGLSAQVLLNGGVLTSPGLSFDLNVEPPNPMLVTPPGQIVRQGVDPRSTDLAAYLPAVQEIEAIIEFPDGLPHVLARTALYVDGVLADENLAEPFDLFIWDLTGYAQSGEHSLQVQASDSLGLEKISQGIGVTVTVVQPERGVLAFLGRNSLYLALGAILVAGVAVGLTLLVARKGHPSGSGRKKRVRASKDPLHAAVQAASPRQAQMRLKGRAAAKQSEAYLLRMKEDGQAMNETPIPIFPPEMTFGSDPLKVNRLLDDASVAPVHARLKVENGRFVLEDLQSSAGTWVNFEVLTAPRPLAHYDLLQFGRFSYRFMLRGAPEKPAPRQSEI